jgi:hypothetical protein
MPSVPAFPMTSRPKHCRLLLPAAACLVLVGCEIRDEQVRTTQPSRLRWPDPISRRLDADTAPAAGQTAGTIAFVESCAAGRRLADAGNKPLLIIFRATWCRWCSAFTQQTLNDPAIVALSEQFVCVQVDADRNGDVCRRYGVTHFPTVLILAADDSELTRRSGHTLAADLQPLLRQALTPDRLAATVPPTIPEPTTTRSPRDIGSEPEQPVQTATTPPDTIGR